MALIPDRTECAAAGALPIDAGRDANARACVAKVNMSGVVALSAVEASDAVTKGRLDSWKAIAEYLKRSPRTVQRWHAGFGLPVHRFGGGKGPVFSYPDELDAWLSGFSEEAQEGSPGASQLSATRQKKSLELLAEADELWELRSEDNLAMIAGLYRSAVDQNPQNGSAFVGMANAITLSAVVGVLRGSAAYPRAAEAVQRALRLGYDAPGARCAVAWLQLTYERDWKRAREGFDDELLKGSPSAYALAGRAILYIAEGNLELAALRLREAWKLNPLAVPSIALLAWVQFLGGAFEQALETVAEARCSGEAGALTSAVEALALAHSPNPDANIQRIEKVAAGYPRSPVVQGALGYLCARCDRTEQARERMRRLERMQGDSHYAIALVAAGLDERHKTILCLEAAYMEGSIWSVGFRLDPALQQIREDPGFRSRLKKLGASS